MYRGTGASRGVRRTTWERSLIKWELQISWFEEFGVDRTFWDSSLLVSLTLWDTPVLFTPPLGLPRNKAPIIHSLLSFLHLTAPAPFQGSCAFSKAWPRDGKFLKKLELVDRKERSHFFRLFVCLPSLFVVCPWTSAHTYLTASYPKARGIRIRL